MKPVARRTALVLLALAACTKPERTQDPGLEHGADVTKQSSGAEPGADWREFHPARRVAEYEQLLLESQGGRSDAGLQLRFARIATSLGRFGEAREAIGHALGASPESAAAHYQLGLLEQRLEHFDAALAAYERALELGPTHVPSWVALGTVHLAARAAMDGADGEADVGAGTALRCFERAVELDSRNADAAFQLALLVQDEDLDRARTLLQTAAENDPWHLGPPMQLARLERRSGNAAAAERWLERHRRLALLEDLRVLDRPTSADRYLAEARHYGVHERWDDALAVCLEGLERHASDPELVWLQAVALEKLGRVTDALLRYADAIELSPRERAYAQGLARVLAAGANVTDRERIAAHLRRAREWWPDDPEIESAAQRLKSPDESHP